MTIERVAVLGAGVMGSGIAAHVTNAGVPVTLLDIVPEGANERNAIAAGALARMLEAKPSPFMERANAARISVGNLEDDLPRLAEADWIIEAVIERLDVKRALYEKIDAVRKPGSIVSSNTSTIPLASLVAKMPESFRRDFLITHFFNPPRYMRLLELVAGGATRADAVAEVREFCDRALGKGVVECKDTPGFIGNRIGVYWLQCAAHEAMRLGLTVEEADAVAGRPMGVPKTGVFGLMDLVGIDLMPHIMASMDSLLDADDGMREYFEIPALVERMIEQGYTGRKGKGGFYRLKREQGRRVKQAIDLESGEYRDTVQPALESLEAARSGGLRALVEHEDRGGVYAWQVLAKTLGYAAGLVPEIADDVVAVDDAMKLGYNWTWGPFELIDRLGAEWFAARMRADGMAVPALLEQAGGAQGFYRVADGKRAHLSTAGGYRTLERAPGVLLLADVKLAGEPVARNASASLWDIGDGVLCLEFHSKMNAIDGDIIAMVATAIETVPGGFEALVIHNEAANFSVGANIGLVLFAANTAAWDDIESMVERGQEAFMGLKHAPFPVVGAPAGMALGGGCEILLHCDALEAHAETYMGLVEVGVGLIPAWGGCKELLLRWLANPRRPGGPMPAVSKVFELVSLASVSTSAAEARRQLFLRPGDGIVMNRDRVLAAAKARALALARDYRAPEPASVALPGASARAALAMAVEGFHQRGQASDYDVVVAMALAGVLSGGDTDITETLGERDLLALERRAFMSLVRRPETIERIEHMLETGKPLRN
ncbi:MAG: 3-hydroxyacyl-CoA dehydrogenase/enoyl-CoA hydratase family protein [Gammaproteobacteria bacterium]|nr:3-hydroxyacyl-CoA dehydrogenase/enoyl-CoA hydratase family protein [Gammaproteobacteria bacterium]